MNGRAVPGNRWDLIDLDVPVVARVSVVVVHYEQPVALARTLAALGAQTVAPYEVIVADDGSATVPDVPAGVRVLTQPDRGFRAAAARNLGAHAATGDVLVFLDADTVPEPGFLAALTARVARCPDVLAVGRRRHADLSALTPGDDPARAPRLPEPAWLRAGYAESRDLLDADGRSFRYVISAVLACGRALFDDLGGFDERYVGYGGEDWDLGYRAWNAGAVLVHESAAVAWHDGPDWAGRAQDDKDHETLRLAALIPEPTTRGAPLPGALPDLLVDLHPSHSRDPATVASTVHSALASEHRDLRVRLPRGVHADVMALYAGVATDRDWTPDQRRRARAHAVLTGPLPTDALSVGLRVLVENDLAAVHLVHGGAPVAVLSSTRAVGRARRHGCDPDALGFGTAILDV